MPLERILALRHRPPIITNPRNLHGREQEHRRAYASFTLSTPPDLTETANPKKTRRKSRGLKRFAFTQGITYRLKRPAKNLNHGFL
ncbi:MAG: hypothetical protein CSA70_12255 [Rhodobacterales bacterium]|nr:MAG: hypothetical protein CSA70_12255 [Rhodobacterales bacterium]